MPKSKPSEVEIVAMAMYWEAWNCSDGQPVGPGQAIAAWDDIISRPTYLRQARAFLRALRGVR